MTLQAMSEKSPPPGATASMHPATALFISFLVAAVVCVVVVAIAA